jgi:hypothetical protein
LVDHVVLDAMEAHPGPNSKPAQRQFDYVLHVGGRYLESTIQLEPRSGPLGRRCGYQHVVQQRAGSVNGVQSVTFAAEEQQLRIWLLPLDNTPIELILADGLTKQPGETQPMLILRRRALQARFLTVLEPIRAGEPLQDVRLSNRAESSGPTVILRSSTGVREIALPGPQRKETTPNTKTEKRS